MLDTNFSLGRRAAQAADVLSVIRPQLRIAHALYVGEIALIRDGVLQATPDLELDDGGDQSADQAVFEALRMNAYDSVKSWALDEGVVFDGPKTQEFIRQALIAAMRPLDQQALPAGALDY